ncbi:MAG: 50S ribosomal protein L19 [Candidatus Ryanbacteria bacterium RIFCSPHIGHO2_02_FULL_45_13b]|uniref:Large ribosomal subunit protein bL19 n=1 Tax=Candidatus Ryanbacteria bacterium RIFCSPHIGHO2_02_FULL_45_13b TaxID=1802117 RepID=A0A1G2G4L6_9BACT|nr:MAG: 50S ribosomal protein L19 [Candidatus Ryanbacteria bacterium RIFCSPHIGHO2_02_FULL_45_13b]
MQSAIIQTPVNVEERKNLDLRSGDTIRVHQRIKEGEKTRLQVFEGLVIARKHGSEAGATFTVRKIVSGVGVERIFPLYSPVIEKIEIIKRSKTRRAKLYYVREKAVKELRKREKKVSLKGLTRMGFDPIPQELVEEQGEKKDEPKSDE